MPRPCTQMVLHLSPARQTFDSFVDQLTRNRRKDLIGFPSIAAKAFTGSNLLLPRALAIRWKPYCLGIHKRSRSSTTIVVTYRSACGIYYVNILRRPRYGAAPASFLKDEE